MTPYRPALLLIVIGLAAVLGCLWISSDHAAVAFFRDHVPGGAAAFLILLYGGAGVVFVGVILLVKAFLAARP